MLLLPPRTAAWLGSQQAQRARRAAQQPESRPAALPPAARSRRRSECRAAAGGGEEPSVSGSHLAKNRTPKQWLGSQGEKAKRVEEIQALRLITAIKTPYLADGRIDLYAFDSLVEQQLAAGVEGLVIGGTTGEGHLMSWDEHIMLIAHTANVFGSRCAVIGNTGSNATREAVHATCQGFAVGMHAALHINPYYGKTSADGLFHHFQAVLDYGPTIVYNVPARTGQDIPAEVVFELAKHPNFAGIKECCGNARIAGYTQRGVVVWSGNDDEAHEARWAAGAVGVISVTSNVVPGLMRQLMFDGPNAEANARLQPFIKWLFALPNPIGVNTALGLLGAAGPIFRLPYAPVGREGREEGAALLRQLGLQHCVRAPDEPQARLRQVDDWTLLERY